MKQLELPLLSPNDSPGEPSMPDQWYVDEDGLFGIADEKKLHPELKKFYKIIRLHTLVTCVESHGYEYEYNIAGPTDRQFLQTIKHIAHDPELLNEKRRQLKSQLPDYKSLLQIPLF